MKKVFASLIVLSIVFLTSSVSFAEGTSSWGNSLQPQFVSYSYCNRIFKMDSQRLFLLTLSSITANRFKIDEIQSRGGYILFTVRATQFLATVMTVDAKHSMLKITPVDGNYYFPIGIVQNCFKYIELNQYTPIEKPQVLP